jgi:sulfite reductase (ferredoxin)
LNYSQRNGERYYYDLLKPLASLETLVAEDYIDWGQEEKFATAIGVGECAGVMIDLISTLIMEAEEKIAASEDCLSNSKWADGSIMPMLRKYILQKHYYCNKAYNAILNMVY